MYKYFDVLFCLGRENAVQILLKYGANINDEDENKSTPLYWAAFQGNICLKFKVCERSNSNINYFIWCHFGGK